MELCDRVQCTGCRACVQICPAHAIAMRMDDDGFYYPEINDSLCQSCGLCQKVCVGIHPPKGNTPFQVYACWNKNSQERMRSTSGGLFIALAQQIVLQGGVVFGAAWIGNGVQHIKCETVDELKRLQGSKYLQSDVKDSYTETEKLLASGRTVLFSGTPCQIAALKAYLRKDHERLYTVENVCHGVPSEKVMQAHKEELESKYGSSITHIRFRAKRPNWLVSSMEYQVSDGDTKECPWVDDPFALGFVANYYLRPSCYQCPYSNELRNADLTLCDFWGYKVRTIRMFHYTDGVSALMTNTEKGYHLFELIKNKIKYEERSLQEVKEHNRNLYAPQKRPEDADQFWCEFKKNTSPFSILAKTFFPKLPEPNYSFKIRAKCFLRLAVLDSIALLKGKKK